MKLCVEAQIPTAQHKTVGPQTSLVFLGVLLDTMCMMASLPKEKLITYRDHIEVVMKQKKIRMKELQSIIGQLQYATCVVTPGKAFRKRLINLTIGHTKPHNFISLKQEAILDLKMWKLFQEKYNGKSFLNSPSLANANRINLFSDASKLGFGATYCSNWIQGKWPTGWEKFNIAILETNPLLALVYTFGVKLRNSSIQFFCDNKAVVDIVNKQSSREPVIMALVRPLVLKMLELNIRFHVNHIRGLQNVLLDKISRFQV